MVSDALERGSGKIQAVTDPTKAMLFIQQGWANHMRYISDAV